MTDRGETDLLETLIENRELVNPNHANVFDVAHGGNVMKWMDEVAAMCAMRFAGELCVTVKVDGMTFERPIPVGDTAFVSGYVYDAGTTSVKVRVRTYREDLRTHERERTTESYFVFVAIDDDREPTPVPDLVLDSPEGRRLREDALEGERNGYRSR